MFRILTTPWRHLQVFLSYVPWIEPITFVVMLWMIIWWIAPSHPGVNPIVAGALLLSLPLLSVWLHHESPRDLGLRFDNFRQSSREVLLATIAITVAVMVLGAAAGWPLHFTTGRWLALLAYPAWGLSQQFILQSFVYRRLRQSGLGPEAAATLAALLFGAIHLPNPVLVIATTLAGYVWCRLFARQQNLFTLALSHAWLAVLIMAQVPNDLHHSMTIGPRFWM